MKTVAIVILIISLLTITCAYPIWANHSRSQRSVSYKKHLGDTLNDCSTSSDHGNITHMSVTPDPPKLNENVKFVVHFTLDETVTDGKIVVVIKYRGIVVYSDTLDLCKTIEQAQYKCPVETGQHVMSVTAPVPGYILSGTYSSTAKLLDQHQEEIACVNSHVHF